MSEPKTIHIKLGPETLAFYRHVADSRPTTEETTEALVVAVDRQITTANEAGHPTADLTEALDELWEHLRAQDLTTPLSDDRLKEILGD